MRLNLASLDGTRFSFDRVSLASYPRGATFGPRTARDYEFVWIEEGDALWEADGVQHDVPADTLLLSRPKMRDFFIWDPRRFTRHGYLHFRIVRRGGLPPESAWPLKQALGHGDIVRPLFRHLAWLAAQPRPEAGVLCQGVLRQILLLFITGACGTIDTGPADESPIVDQTMRFVRDRWAKGAFVQPSLNELARAAAVSRGHLVRVFREQLGVTPAEALRLLRLDHAATLLARSNLRISEIADQTGFISAFHFSRAFRLVYASSPRAFRQEVAAGYAIPPIRFLRVRELADRLLQGAGR
jgi:AraC-like DNA-binding protein